MSRAIELGKKLYELAKRGEGGEKATAERMLHMHLKKHGLTLSDIESEQVNMYSFKVKKGFDWLWKQIVACVDGSLKLYGVRPEYRAALGLKYFHVSECTASQFVLIQSKLDFYTKHYEKDLEVFNYAFLSKNDLLVESDDENWEPTEDEIRIARQAKGMSLALRKGQFERQLTPGQGGNEGDK